MLCRREIDFLTEEQDIARALGISAKQLVRMQSDLLTRAGEWQESAQEILTGVGSADALFKFHSDLLGHLDSPIAFPSDLRQFDPQRPVPEHFLHVEQSMCIAQALDYAASIRRTAAALVFFKSMRRDPDLPDVAANPRLEFLIDLQQARIFLDVKGYERAFAALTNIGVQQADLDRLNLQSTPAEIVSGELRLQEWVWKAVTPKEVEDNDAEAAFGESNNRREIIDIALIAFVRGRSVVQGILPLKSACAKGSSRPNSA